MMASNKRMAQSRLRSAKSAGGFGPADEKVDQAAHEMEAQNNDNPDQLFNTVETLVRNGVDEHPNPEDARRNSESPNENDEQQSNQSCNHRMAFV
jgi:hypothetical protein